jgi:hypothetical protein
MSSLVALQLLRVKERLYYNYMVMIVVVSQSKHIFNEHD